MDAPRRSRLLNLPPRTSTPPLDGRKCHLGSAERGRVPGVGPHKDVAGLKGVGVEVAFDARANHRNFARDLSVTEEDRLETGLVVILGSHNHVAGLKGVRVENAVDA